ncbi:type I-E CRISPR-associated protein Cse2/CasB [Geopseudomonas guangdongensis]|uniref:CRISPR-associated protein, Cse2 family n=1 Tax=Geopseudomonas guangdongensis TaxID=1245526 RepID=A0A1H2GI59_9GAMM|nr:type I-E CRISPR-associated protein Cse2/CasB [Pseudomonas guangdongensis]SDU19406.1 CRISPR-associated protein, Cse2 family [Pseudomonas guangdongensis]
MSNFAQDFVAHLIQLRGRNSGALAELRRSLSFAPGAHVKAFPYVERFVARDSHPQDAQRLALYLVAGLFALHPQPAPRTLAAAFGELMRQRDSDSIEKRFIALLGADAENLADYLRHVISLLAADDIGLDYASLLDDLRFWLNPRLDPDARDRIRQRWARDFYRALAHDAEPATHHQD